MDILQGSSVQSQKLASSAAQLMGTDVSNAIPGQPKVVSLPPGVASAGQVASTGLIQPGGKAGATPILISLPINGQPTTVLLDPVTMQVLGTVNSQQPGPGSVAGTAPTAAGPVTSLAGQPGSQGVAAAPTTGGKGKNKNNANQRAICPKPSSTGDGSKMNATPSKKKKSSKLSNKNKETVQPDSLSDSLQIQIPESTTDPEVTSAISSESTDILAKAAESIFSSPLGEMGTVGGFYNPANEDNPLHIDTSVTEADEENKSPSKNAGDKKGVESVSSAEKRTLEDNVMGLNSVADGVKAFGVSSNSTKVVNKANTVMASSKMAEPSSNDSVTSLSETLEEIAGMGFDETQMEVSQDRSNSDLTDISMDGKSVKKTKPNAGAKPVDNKKDANPKVNKKPGGTKGNAGTAVKEAGQKKPGTEVEKTDSDSQMDIESTIIHIPEAITFSENDLSDVLDQVEQLGNSSVQSPQRAQGGKKSKTKRSKGVETENEPASKKRKGAKEVKSGKNSKEIPLSLPSSLSVYDFDDSDDIVPTILPLNGKDFSTTLSSAPSMPTKADMGLSDTNSNDSRSSVGNKTTKTSAQSKPPSAASQKNTSAKSAKSATESSSSKVTEETSNVSLFNFPESLDKPADKESNVKDKPEAPKLPETSSSESIHSMPDMDTTTSLFGFPVPKKLQRPDVSKPSSQVSPKPISQVSPKPPAQVTPVSKPLTVSPKQSIASPKTSTISPKQSIVSPEMMSPKLNIVSPSHSLLSDNEGAPSPKRYTEMSPLKKRPAADRMDNVKISPFSALNSASIPNTASESSVTVTVNKDNLSVSATVSNSKPSGPSGVITPAKPPVTNTPKMDSNEQMKSSESSNKSQNDAKVPLLDTSESKSSAGQKTPMPPSIPSSKSSVSSRNTYSTPTVDSDAGSQGMPGAGYNTGPPMPPRSHSAATSQNNKYGPSPPKYGNEPMYGPMMGMNTSKPMSKENNMPGAISSMNTFPAPYSSESIFSNQDKVIKSPPNVNIQNNPNMTNQDKSNANMKVRNNAYSVDSFVQSSREDGMRMRSEGVTSQPDLMDTGDLGNPSSDFSRLQSASSPDGFNFSNIGLNLQPITTTAPSSNFMDLTLPNSSTVITSNSSSFSFSLSSTTSTVSTTTSGVIGQHQFPFYPVLSTTSSASSSEPGMSNMGMFGQNNVIQRNTVMHPSASSSNMQRPDNSHMSRMESSIQRVDNQHGMQRGDSTQSVMSDDLNREQISTSKSSCSKQSKMSKVPSQNSIQDSCSFSNAGSGREPNFFHDNQMKSNVGKSPTDQMRKPPDMNPTHSHSNNPPSHQEKRANIDRSPQMMNNAPGSYFSPNYPPAKSLNTPPLHHPSLMPPDDRSRNMTNRSPYDNPYHPPSSQGFNPMNHNYPQNRFESSNYNRDNSGTQPLSHTPVNSGGRKSANPQQSVVKPPPKQTAPPLVPMAPQQQQQPPPPSQGPRPTPPQSHRANTPINNNNPPPPAPTPTQVNQSRHSKQPSRSKPPSKKNKSVPPFVEVDSNLSNSIFETNRSMTPFFPMQNLSPQSRAMQHEGSPFPLGNFFGAGPRFANSNTPMPKNSDIGTPFNPLFPPRGAQNGLGLNFQHGFGMNMNPLHSNHGNGPQITPHTASHMTNFNLNNIFPDVNSASQNESSLNISPIKFPHTNFQHQGMEHNAMQHHHQYNRGHPSVMSINSILGPNHRGFDGHMNTSMAGFHSHAHPSFIPTLNFSMHDH